MTGNFIHVQIFTLNPLTWLQWLTDAVASSIAISVVVFI